jgi:hypothetical protein
MDAVAPWLRPNGLGARRPAPQMRSGQADKGAVDANDPKNEAVKRSMIARRLRQGWTRTRAMSGAPSVGGWFFAAIDV